MVWWFNELVAEAMRIDVYHYVALFAIYSMMGWLVESIYMSICNRKITNRGFGRGPFCPIYGFGCIGGYLIFAPFKGKYLVIYIGGCIVATTFEYIVGMMMIKFLGELWWDYSNKPFNYKGILCLESTLAWGIYALVVVHFLHGFMMGVVDHIPKTMGVIMLAVIFFLAFLDYMVQFGEIFGWPKALGGKGMKEKPDLSRANRVNHPE